MSLDKLKDSYSSITSQFYNQMGIRDHFISEKARLITEMSELNQFLDSKDEVQRVLHELQTRTQSKTKGIYESLLTKLVKDIMPDNDESDSVVLNTGVKNNKTTLSVEVANKKGFTRDVYLDKGGSIENIVAMGLRFIALSRVSNRRFLILDEADSWLKDIYIPAFAEVLCQLSRRVGIQVVYISHHDVENFVGKAKIINLSRDNGKIVAEDKSYETEAVFEGVDDDELPELMDGVGIDYIRLVNFKQHENTLLELSPNVTIITGDNDIGKTTILQAIEAVNQNSGRDGLIRDDQPYCRVEFGIEDEMTLAWSYKRKGQKKTKYVLTDDENTVVKESDNGKDIPEWLHDYLAMNLYKDFDLHIGDQHSASFILDKKISSHKRAEILSLGKEASKVQKMITLHGEKVASSKRELNRKKKEINDVKNKLALMRDLDKKVDTMNQVGASFGQIEQLTYDLEDIKSQASLIKKLADINNALTPSKSLNQLDRVTDDTAVERLLEKLTRLTSLEGKHSSLLPSKDLVNLSPVEIEDLVNMESSLLKIEKLELINAAFNPIQNVNKLNITDFESLDGILEKGRLISFLQNKLDVISKAKDLNQVDISTDKTEELEGISYAGSKISQLMKKQSMFKRNIEEANIEKDSINKEYSDLIDEIGGICPTCNSEMNNKPSHEGCQ